MVSTGVTGAYGTRSPSTGHLGAVRITRQLAGDNGASRGSGLVGDDELRATVAAMPPLGFISDFVANGTSINPAGVSAALVDAVVPARSSSARCAKRKTPHTRHRAAPSYPHDTSLTENATGAPSGRRSRAGSDAITGRD
jgi:hypothetical protein